MAAKPPLDETPKDTAENAAETAAPKKSGLMSVLIPSAIMAVVMGGIGFALAYFVVPGRLQPATAVPAATAASPAGAATTPASSPTASAASDAAPAAPAVAAGTPAPTDEKTKRTPEEIAAEGGKAVTKFTIEDLTVNIADTRGNRFVRAGVFFEADPTVLEELEANRARMIDTVEQVLSTKTLDQLTSPNIRGSLREELLGIINPTLKAGHVQSLYFTDLLVQ